MFISMAEKDKANRNDHDTGAQNHSKQSSMMQYLTKTKITSHMDQRLKESGIACGDGDPQLLIVSVSSLAEEENEHSDILHSSIYIKEEPMDNVEVDNIRDESMPNDEASLLQHYDENFANTLSVLSLLPNPVNRTKTVKNTLPEPKEPACHPFEYFYNLSSGSVADALKSWSSFDIKVQNAYKTLMLQAHKEYENKFKAYLDSLEADQLQEYWERTKEQLAPENLQNYNETGTKKKEINNQKKKPTTKKKPKLSKKQQQENLKMKELIKNCLVKYNVFLNKMSFDEFKVYATLQEIDTDVEHTNVVVDDVDELKEIYSKKYKLFLRGLQFDDLQKHAALELEETIEIEASDLQEVCDK